LLRLPRAEGEGLASAWQTVTVEHLGISAIALIEANALTAFSNCIGQDTFIWSVQDSFPVLLNIFEIIGKCQQGLARASYKAGN
jgi:hypothetical protein